MRAAVREYQKKLQDQVTTDNQIDESPRRKAARNDACIYQKRGGQQMKDMVYKVNGCDIEVGCVVQVTLKNMDSTKVDGKNLALVVVEKVSSINNAHSKYRLACAKEPMQNLFSRWTFLTRCQS